MYLVTMAIAIFGEVFVRGRLIVTGDATQTAQNIIAAEQLFRLSIIGDLLTYSGVIVLLWAFYVMVRPIDRNLALLGALLRLAENAILFAATIYSFIALRLLSGSAWLGAFEDGQLHALARLSLNAQGFGMNIAFVLTGLGSAVFAYVLLKSRYVPKAIAVWGIFASLTLAIVTLAVMVFPGIWDAIGMAYMGPMGIYEVGLGVWLIVRGIREPGIDPPARTLAAGT